jgi:outer membrane immunogenic protein
MRTVALVLVAVSLVASPVQAGPYLGLFAGYDDANEAWASQGGASLSPEGVVAGGYLGADWRFGVLVAGAEADLMFADMAETEPCDTTAFDCTLDGRVMGSLRARGGVTLRRALLYVTAGPALSYVRATANIPGGDSDSQILAGWTLGGGGEIAFGEQVRLGLEYRHTDYGESDFALGGADERIRFATDEVTLRLTFLLE